MSDVLVANSMLSSAALIDIVPVILSGGSGTRLWPVSRESFPKQFWGLTGKWSMIAETALRSAGAGFAPPVIVCNIEHRFLVAEHMRSVGIANPRLLLEPFGRNSAAAVAAAALLVFKTDPKAVIWVMAADSAIEDVPKLHAILAQAAAGARAGHIVTLGIHPTAPETGYGYIRVGAPLPNLPGVYAVAEFTEKPDAASAHGLVESGAFWNAGMFVFTAETLLEEMRRHAPEVLAAVQDALANAENDLDFIRLQPDSFANSPDISLDYAIAELSDRIAVVPADIAWTDVGSWNALWELGQHDADGNVAVGDVLLEGSSDCYVRSDGILTAVVGLKDVVVVVTDDAVLAMHRERSQDVKKIVETLRKANRHEAVSHNRIYRPWGFYESLIQGDRFQVKRIVVTPGHKLSLQKHFHRAEHWVVVSGSAVVTRDAEEIFVRENESIYLPLGTVHRLENPGRIPLTLIEVQSGSYLGEDDIVRIEDTYGRS